jgi:deoxyribonuclease-4
LPDRRDGVATQRIGIHLGRDGALAAAAERGADAVQFFLGDPQGWKVPPPGADTDELRASPLAIYVHAPYGINLASANNRVRIPSRKLLAQTCEGAAVIGAAGVIVHGGHVTGGDSEEEGFLRWRKAMEQLDSPVPVLLENTAGGDHAMARRLETVARLWEHVGDFGLGFCLDTCHAHAGGEELDGVVDRVKAITGRIDLVHANDSKDPGRLGPRPPREPRQGPDRPGHAGRGGAGGGSPGHLRDPGRAGRTPRRPGAAPRAPGRPLAA